MPQTRKEIAARYYAKNREKILKEKKTFRQNNREAIAEYDKKRYDRAKAILDEARSHPCVDCGIQLPPECMDLDHVRGEKKIKLCVSYAKGYAEKAIRAEIEKCEVRCPNCHRLRHHNEKEVDARED